MNEGDDGAYLRMLLAEGVIAGSTLEVGSYERQGSGGNARHIIVAAGLRWTGTDIAAGPGVDFTLDMSDRSAVEHVADRWDSVLVMNVLEHVYDPIGVLRNAVTLLNGGGTCVVVVPVVWQLHDFPGDYWRPLPDFFAEFARREALKYEPQLARWLTHQRQLPVTDEGGQKLLPHGREVFGVRRAQWSRVVHRLFNTTGRSIGFPYTALGVVLRKP